MNLESVLCDWESVGNEYKCKRCGLVVNQPFRLACQAAPVPEQPKPQEPTNNLILPPQQIFEATSLPTELPKNPTPEQLRRSTGCGGCARQREIARRLQEQRNKH